MAANVGPPLALPTASCAIDQMPDELLVNVFEHLVVVYQELVAALTGTARRPPPPFFVGQVCRRWRSIYRGMPALFPPIRWSNEQMKWVTATPLSPAGYVLLSIFFDGSREALFIMAPMLPHTLHLRLVCRRGLAASLAGALCIHVARHLEELDLDLRGQPSHKRMFANSVKTPVLRTLQLSNTLLELDAVGPHVNLSAVNFCNVSVVPGTLFKILDAAPALRTFSLRNVTTASPSTGHVILPRQNHQSPLELLVCSTGEHSLLQALAELLIQAGLCTGLVQFTLVILPRILAEFWTGQGVFYGFPSPLLRDRTHVHLWPFAFAGYPHLCELIITHVAVSDIEFWYAIMAMPFLRTLGIHAVDFLSSPLPMSGVEERHQSSDFRTDEDARYIYSDGPIFNPQIWKYLGIKDHSDSHCRLFFVGSTRRSQVAIYRLGVLLWHERQRWLPKFQGDHCDT